MCVQNFLPNSNVCMICKKKNQTLLAGIDGNIWLSGKLLSGNSAQPRYALNSYPRAGCSRLHQQPV